VGRAASGRHLDDIARFGDFSRDDGEVVRTTDEIVFAGRGPLGLYTEVAVDKYAGAIRPGALSVVTKRVDRERLREVLDRATAER
jgi:hypothetical protein